MFPKKLKLTPEQAQHESETRFLQIGLLVAIIFLVASIYAKDAIFFAVVNGY